MGSVHSLWTVHDQTKNHTLTHKCCKRPSGLLADKQILLKKKRLTQRFFDVADFISQGRTEVVPSVILWGIWEGLVT